jgi:hypothetical protein
LSFFKTTSPASAAPPNSITFVVVLMGFEATAGLTAVDPVADDVEEEDEDEPSLVSLDVSSLVSLDVSELPKSLVSVVDVP